MNLPTAAPTPRGFTLIELMVAIAITAILCAIGYQALDQGMQGRHALAQTHARLLALQSAIQQFEQDVELLQPRPVRKPDGNGWDYAIFSGSGAGGSSSSSLAQQSAALLTLTRGGWTNPVGLPRGELQRVSYVLDQHVLVRQYLPVLDPAGDLPLVRRELLQDVESVHLRFMDDGFHWNDTWPPLINGAQPQPGLLRMRPLAIELVVTLKDYGTVTRVIEVL